MHLFRRYPCPAGNANDKTKKTKRQKGRRANAANICISNPTSTRPSPIQMPLSKLGSHLLGTPIDSHILCSAEAETAWKLDAVSFRRFCVLETGRSCICGRSGDLWHKCHPQAGMADTINSWHLVSRAWQTTQREKCKKKTLMALLLPNCDYTPTSQSSF